MQNKSFAAFILTHGRADHVYTYNTLRNCGYTGKVYFIIDNEDSQIEQYKENYGKQVIVFDKKEIAKTFDAGDNFNDRRAIIYARNASFEIAKSLNLKYFIQLDDDYTGFRYQFNSQHKYSGKPILNLDNVFGLMLEYYKSTTFKSIAFGQGGDYLGGQNGGYSKKIFAKRKCMNSFICSTDRPFQFVGRINEDVNTYTWFQSLGNLFLTILMLRLEQKTTQANSGGMTELYLDTGTYLKSFYSVMYSPSPVKIETMKSNHKRLHHKITWKNAVPVIISEDYKLK